MTITDAVSSLLGQETNTTGRSKPHSSKLPCSSSYPDNSHCPWLGMSTVGESFMPVWWCHQLLSGFHLPRVSHQSRRFYNHKGNEKKPGLFNIITPELIYSPSPNFPSLCVLVSSQPLYCTKMVVSGSVLASRSKVHGFKPD